MADDQAPETIRKSSSAKKKAKKEKKKRKRDSSDGASSPIINGAKENGSSSKKKKKDKNKRQSKENGHPTTNGSSAEPDAAQQASDAQEIINIQSADQPPAGSIFNLITTSSRSTDSSKSSSSPYQIKTIQGSVALLPTSLPNVTQCIQSLLHSLLLMYDANMGGVLLSLEDDVKILPIDNKAGFMNTNTRGGLIGGRIVDDLPYIHYRFQVSGLLFCPVVGMKLRGQVIECTPTYITLTCHHILSTKISTEKLREMGFFYNSLTLEWTRERDTGATGDDDGDEVGPSTSIYLDDTVEFVVERIHECGGYISLDGTHPSVSTLG